MVTYVDILRPTGGEVFVNGQQQLIAVQLHSKVATCTIELSRDGGLNFTEIVGTINNLKLNRRPVHEVAFAIVGPDSPECVLRATALVAPKNLVFTDTTAVFTIGSPNLIPGSVTESILSSNSVSTIKIQDGAVTSAKIADGTVSSADIADGAVGSADIADGSVSSTDIADGTIATGDLADGSVTNPKIADLAVTSSKLGDGSVNSAKILDGTIAAVDIANATITPAKIQQSDPGQVLIAQGVGNSVEYKALSGDVLLGATGLTTITAGAVGTAELIGQSVTRTKLERAGLGQLIVGQGPGADMDFKTLSGDATLDLNGALVINNSAITTGKIADNAITTGKIADGQVQTADLADASVTNAKAAPELHRDSETKDIQFVGNGSGTIFLDDAGTSNTTSGAFLVGVFDEFTSFNATNVQAALSALSVGLDQASRKFNPIGTPDNSVSVTLDTAGDTQLDIQGTAGMRVFGASPLDGVNGARTITVTVRNGGLTATQLQDTVAGTGLAGGTPLDGLAGPALSVNVAAPLSVSEVPDTVSIAADGITGAQLADNITSDTTLQEWSFPAPSLFQLSFDGSSSGASQVFRVERGGTTELLSLQADGQLNVAGVLSVTGATVFNGGLNLNNSGITNAGAISGVTTLTATTVNTPTITTPTNTNLTLSPNGLGQVLITKAVDLGANSLTTTGTATLGTLQSGDGTLEVNSNLNLGANTLSTTGTINAGTLNVTGGVNVSGLSSPTDATVTVDNDNNGANTFFVRGNDGTLGVPFNMLSLNESLLLRLGPANAASPEITTDGANDLRLSANGAGIVIVNDSLAINGTLDLNANSITDVNTLTATAVNATTLTGSGAGVTNVDAATLGGNNSAFFRNATNINAGTIGSAFLPANVALEDATNSFTQTNTFITAAGDTSIIIRDSAVATANDIFTITNNGGGTTFLRVDTNGLVQVPAAPVNATDVVNKTYADGLVAAKLNTTGGTLTGALTLNTAGGTDLVISETGFQYTSGAAETLTIDNGGGGTTSLSLEGNISGTAAAGLTITTTTSALTLDTVAGQDVVVDPAGAGEMDVNRILNVSGALNANGGLNVSGGALDLNSQVITDVGASLTSSAGAFTVTSSAGNGAINVSSTGSADVTITGGATGDIALNAGTGGTITTSTIVAGAVARQVTSASTTPSVANATSLVMTATATVTDLQAGVVGQIVVIVAGTGATVTINDGGNFSLLGASAFVGTPDSTLTVVRVGSVWVEVARSIN